MYRLLFIVAFALTVYSSPVLSAGVVSNYTGPILEHAANRAEGMEMCRKAHVLGFYKNFNRTPPIEMLGVMMQEAKNEDYCYGYFGQGDNDGNHSFSCYGITWTGGAEIDLHEKCEEEWERSKNGYGEWLEKAHPLEYL